MPPGEQAGFAPVTSSLFGLLIAQLAIAVLGTQMVTSESATGMIVPSLAAVPRRARLLLAKAAVFAVVAFLVGTATGFCMLITGQAVLTHHDVPSIPLENLAGAEVGRPVLGAGRYLAVLGVLAVAVGALVRWTAGAISVLVSGILLIPSLAGSLPDAWARAVETYWPTNAGLQVVLNGPDGLSPWTGFGVMCAFAVFVLITAVAVFRHRDA